MKFIYLKVLVQIDREMPINLAIFIFLFYYIQ